jgi:hypothetical protein
MEPRGRERHRWKNREVDWSFGKSDIEGKAAREAASECAQRASFNGACGARDIEGKAAMGSGENEPRGRERHRWANRKVDMGGST